MSLEVTRVTRAYRWGQPRLGLDAVGEALGDGAGAYFGRVQLAATEARALKTYAAQLANRGIAANTIRLYFAPVKGFSPRPSRTG